MQKIELLPNLQIRKTIFAEMKHAAVCRAVLHCVEICPFGLCPSEPKWPRWRKTGVGAKDWPWRAPRSHVTQKLSLQSLGPSSARQVQQLGNKCNFFLIFLHNKIWSNLTFQKFIFKHKLISRPSAYIWCGCPTAFILPWQLPII